MKYIKRFYIITVLAGLLLMFTNMSVPPQLQGTHVDSIVQGIQKNKVIKQVNDLKIKGLEKVNDAFLKNNKITDNAINHRHLKDAVKNKKDGTQYFAKLEPETGLYIIQNKRYVYFKGAYHPYNKKNIYKINGTFYNYTPKPAINYAPVKKDTKNSAAKTNYNKQLHTDFKTSPSFGGAYNSDNVKNVMDNLKKAQSNMNVRNKALNQIMDQ